MLFPGKATSSHPPSLLGRKKIRKTPNPNKTTTNSSISSPLVIPRPKKKSGLVLFYPEKAIMSLKKKSTNQSWAQSSQLAAHSICINTLIEVLFFYFYFY